MKQSFVKTNQVNNHYAVTCFNCGHRTAIYASHIYKQEILITCENCGVPNKMTIIDNSLVENYNDD